MRLEIASYKAIKYACLKFHYAKAVPVNITGYSVFNNNKDWCGCIVYALGANNNLPKRYGLKQGQAAELVRVALNGKHESTSKALALSIKLFKKNNPLCKIIISYADNNQNHYGTIYQATNWIYDGNSVTTSTPVLNGKRVHAKSIRSKFGTNNTEKLRARGINIQYEKDKPKNRYIYPLDKSLIPLCKSLAKPYPKKPQALEVNQDKRSDSIGEIGGSNPTPALHKTVTEQ